eukprot:5764576-Pyramimonas_sp.AAC.1
MENPSRSATWKQTDLKLIPYILMREVHDNVTDQCAHGAWSEDLKLPLRKRTFLRSTIRLRSTSRACKCITKHAELQGAADQGRKLTALAA